LRTSPAFFVSVCCDAVASDCIGDMATFDEKEKASVQLRHPYSRPFIDMMLFEVVSHVNVVSNA
jgi:hypothetical protein